WDNLTPLTQSANNRGINSMLNKFEDPVKTAVEDKKTVTDFDVKTDFSAPSRSGELAQIAEEIPLQKTAAERKRVQIISEVIEAEQHSPLRVICNVKIDGKALGEVTVDNDPRTTTSWRDYKVAE